MKKNVGSKHGRKKSSEKSTKVLNKKVLNCNKWCIFGHLISEKSCEKIWESSCQPRCNWGKQMFFACHEKLNKLRNGLWLKNNLSPCWSFPLRPENNFFPEKKTNKSTEVCRRKRFQRPLFCFFFLPNWS